MDRDSVNMKTFCLQDTCLVQCFKVASDPWVGAEIGLGSMHGPGDARFPFAMTGHLVMVGQEYLSDALEQVNASLQ